MIMISCYNIKYMISIKGEIFIHQGGYKGQMQRTNQEKNRIRDLEDNAQKNDGQIISLTRVLVWATGVLALDSIIHIGSIFYRHFCH